MNPRPLLLALLATLLLATSVQALPSAGTTPVNVPPIADVPLVPISLPEIPDKTDAVHPPAVLDCEVSDLQVDCGVWLCGLPSGGWDPVYKPDEGTGAAVGVPQNFVGKRVYYSPYVGVVYYQGC